MGSGFDQSFQRTLATQSWSLYGVGMFLIALRLYARIHRVGINGLTPDDSLMVVAASFYTTLIVSLNVIATGGGSNLFPPEQFSTFTMEEIQERIKGSKIVIVSEQAMLNVIYTLKVCLLFLYYRLTKGTHQNRWVKVLGAYVIVGWFATEIAFFTTCRPFNGYWAVPPADPQCATLQHYAMVQACFNLTSDVLMLCIALPMITQLRLPLKQKIVLALVFSMGIFIILAAILTKVYNLTDVYSTSYMLWYTREASVAVYVANLPLIWPLLREWFPFLRNMSSIQRSIYSARQHNHNNKNNNTTSFNTTPRPSPTMPNNEAVKPSRDSAHDVVLDPGKRRGTADGYSFESTDGRSSRDVGLCVGVEMGVFEPGSAAQLVTIKRGGSPASDERRLQTTTLEQCRSFWGKGNIKAQVKIEVEHESVDLESGGAAVGSRRSGWGKPEREVRIEGGRGGGGGGGGG